MSTLLFEAANTNPDKFIIGKLPIKHGEVSIMTIEQLHKALGGYREREAHDFSYGYNTSKYYVYGICDLTGSVDPVTGSTVDNLQAVGLQWYKQLNKPTAYNQTWTINNHKVFGGPLYGVYYYGSDYYFDWWYSISDNVDSSYSIYWDSDVSSSVYVVVVCAHE